VKNNMLKFLSVVATLCIAAGSLVAQKRSDLLFSLKSEGKAMAEAQKSSIGSVRETEIVFGSDARGILTGARLTVQLFDGKQFTADRGELETRAMDDITWRGKIEAGAVDGDVIITFRKGFYSGLIYSPTAVYEIIPRGDAHMLVELDQSKFPECGGGMKSDETARATEDENLVGVDSGDRIDVLVVYTTATKNVLGGDAQAQAHAQAAIDATNTAYRNSKIRQRVRLVHSQEFVYTESTGSADLSALRNNPTIQALRNTHQADLVAEISEVTGVCGIGYLMGGAAGNQNNGFTVTARSCAVGNLSFAHELGHNMGSQHNPENGSGPTYPYGFGHYINGSYRTVMSYVDPCASGCTRVAYFSNPNVIFNGQPTGINNARDNARSINNTGDVIAAYRYSGSSITMTSFNGGNWLPRLVARNVTWSSDNITGDVRIEVSRDESTNWETVVASTPNDGSQAISVVGRATRRARLRVTSINSPTVSDSSVTNIVIR
jgi:hypothetical protein